VLSAHQSAGRNPRWILESIREHWPRTRKITIRRLVLRIDQSKGLKDRFVYLSQAAASALRDYLDVRGASITPHQLRHSCATMLLNTSAPVVIVQSILGYKRIDTTLRYARLYDGTISADYYEAMAKIEVRMEMELQQEPVTANQDVLGLILAIESSPLDVNQQFLISGLKTLLLSLPIQDVKVLDGNI
jgi:hypothetical protein